MPVGVGRRERIVLYSSDIGIDARRGMERVFGRGRPLNVVIRTLTIRSLVDSMLRVRFACLVSR